MGTRRPFEAEHGSAPVAGRELPRLENDADLVERLDGEHVPMRSVPGRRTRTAVPRLTEAVLLLGPTGGDRTLAHPRRGRIDPGDQPVDEGPARRIGIDQADPELR